MLLQATNSRRKIAALAIAILLVITLTGCGHKATGTASQRGNSSSPTTNTASSGNQSIAATAYPIQVSEISQGSIKIQYPQLTGMSDTAKQATINALIKKDIYDSSVGESLKLYPIDQISYNLSCRVTLNTTKILSIVYLGDAAITNGSSSKAVFGTTIDLGKATVMKLSDFVTVNTDFAGKVLQAPNWTYLDGQPKDGNLSAFIQDETSQNLLTDIQSGDSAFYLTPRSLVVGVAIGNALGDYALVDLPGQYATN